MKDSTLESSGVIRTCAFMSVTSNGLPTRRGNDRTAACGSPRGRECNTSSPRLQRRGCTALRLQRSALLRQLEHDHTHAGCGRDDVGHEAATCGTERTAAARNYCDVLPAVRTERDRERLCRCG